MLLIVIVVLALSLAPLPAAAAPPPASIVAESQIERVTVYPDRAVVERFARDLPVEKGPVHLVFEGLPQSLMQESIRASGEGTARADIVNVDVRRSYLKTSAPAEAESLRAIVEELEARKRRILARKEGEALAGDFLKSIKVSTEQAAPKEISEGRATPEQFRSILDLLRDEFGENQMRMIAKDESVAALDRRLSALRGELQQLGQKADRWTWTVAVDLLVEKAGDLAVALDYAVSGATWSPSYDVRVSDDLSKIELVYYGVVQQTTGEAWEEVEVALSTAEPGLGVQVPTLTAWWLAMPAPPPAVRAQSEAIDVESSSSERKIAVKYEFKHRAINTVADALSKEAGVVEQDGQLYVRGGPANETQYFLDGLPIADPFASPSSSGITARFEVPVPQSLASDGTARRMTVSTLALEGDVAYETVPRFAPYAYLVAKVRNASEIPILAGATQVFLGAQFLGNGRIEDAAARQEFDLSLGVDKAVRVERKLLKKDRQPASRADGDERIAFVYRTEIRNEKAVPIRIKVRDQFPVSQDRSIVVTEKRLEPMPFERSRDEGLLTWDLSMPPSGKELVEIGYEVKYPSGKAPLGL